MSAAAAERSAPVAPAGAKATPKEAGAGFHIPSLDGIRAISFFTVFFAHGGLGRFVPGYFGLNLFFFLSGFLITTLLRMEVDHKGDISFRQFYLRRALRIWPPFYVVLFVAYAFTWAGLMGGQLTWNAVLAQLLHVTNYYIIRHGWWEGLAPGTWVYWSLAVEEHFYLVFPLLYLWCRRRFPSGADQAKILLGLCALILLWRCVLIFGFDVIKERTYVASDTRVDSIIAGCILAIWRNPVFEPEGFRDRSLLLVWLPLGALALITSLVIRVPAFEQTFRYTLQSFGLLPFFVAAMRWPNRLPFRWLNTRVAKRLGVLSYSMYLMHTSLLWALERWLPWPTAVRTALAVLILVILGSLINEFIEKPAGKARHRLARYLEPA